MKPNSTSKSSKKILLITIVLVAVLATAGVLWFILTRDSNDNDKNNGDGTSETATTFTGTMFDARDKTTDGKSLECDWTLDYDGEALLSEGKIYANGKGIIRSTATFEKDGKTHESNTVIANDQIFDWYDNDAESTSKVPLATVEGQPPMKDTYAQSEQIDPNATFSFTCHEWEADSAVYQVPIPLNQLPGQD
jgi:hypothetical protein